MNFQKLYFCSVSACGYNKLLARGDSYQVSSPKIPGSVNYVNDGNCSWLFEIQSAFQPAKVLVTVTANNLADAASCGDYTELQPASGTPVKLCGSQSIGDSWTMDKLLIKFLSNSAAFGTGTDLHVSSKIQLKS